MLDRMTAPEPPKATHCYEDQPGTTQSAAKLAGTLALKVLHLHRSDYRDRNASQPGFCKPQKRNAFHWLSHLFVRDLDPG